MAHALAGYAPVYDDGTGGFIDTNSIVPVGEIDTGALGPRARERRINNLRNRLAKLTGEGDAPFAVEANNAHDVLSASGLIDRNRYIGLGYVAVSSTSTGSLSATAQRSVWAKAIILQSTGGTNAAALVVTQIDFAGIPETIGTGGIPVQAFDYANTRYGFATNKPVTTGQAITVDFYNYYTSAIGVSGNVIVDEVDPGVQRRLAEMDLLRAAHLMGNRCG